MATYRFTKTSAVGVSLKLTERPVKGSSRLGSLRKEVELYCKLPLITYMCSKKCTTHPSRVGAYTHRVLPTHGLLL